MPARTGEVIAASTVGFTAESYELHSPPALGSLVTTADGDIKIYGVVCNALTESIDPGRRPIARGREEDDERDIYLQHPQLSKLLRTTFDALIVGHSDGDRMCHYLPPRPPRVHTFVHLCEQEEIREFTDSLDFLPTLLEAGLASRDEVVTACLRLASSAHPDQRAFMVGAGKELAVLLSGQLSRLNPILRRIRA